MYLSNKLDQLKRSLTVLLQSASGPEKDFYECLGDIVCDMAGQVDVLSEKAAQLEQQCENYNTYTEHLSATLQGLQNCIIGDVSVDTDSYTSEYDHDHSREAEEFVTVQCPFCEELFLCDSASGETVSCPLCDRPVSVADNRVDRE